MKTIKKLTFLGLVLSIGVAYGMEEQFLEFEQAANYTPATTERSRRDDFEILPELVEMLSTDELLRLQENSFSASTFDAITGKTNSGLNDRLYEVYCDVDPCVNEDLEFFPVPESNFNTDSKLNDRLYEVYCTNRCDVDPCATKAYDRHI